MLPGRIFTDFNWIHPSRFNWTYTAHSLNRVAPVAVVSALHTSRSLARIQAVAPGTPVSDLSWAIHEGRKRWTLPGAIPCTGYTAAHGHVSAHPEDHMLLGTYAGRRLNWGG